jgi:hypothetical protein
MQLEDYHAFKVLSFEEYNPADAAGMDLNDA